MPERRLTSFKFKPMTDGEVVHDILSLGSVTNEHRVLPTLWRRQIHMFHLLEAMAEEEIDNTPIMEVRIWSTTRSMGV